MRRTTLIGLSAAIIGCVAIGAGDLNSINLADTARADSSSSTPGLVLPKTDLQRGRELFVSKHCVVCHSINGVGGTNAAALDASTMDPTMNPFEFFARMWLGAKPMITMQEERMGEQMELTAEELGNIVAFIHDEEIQESFSDKDIPDEIEDLME
ncbi:MAG TPA: cytochrome c [Alphaproteobacteria bacterium]|nr:cytochrome c [Alphaproteobacteria bacterium]